jgi:DNA-binding transcriptional MerR regulator
MVAPLAQHLLKRDWKPTPRPLPKGDAGQAARLSGEKSEPMNMMPAGKPVANANDATNEATEDLTRIGEMAKSFGVTLRTLRFYEDKGLLKPFRDGATRLYTRRDKARLKLILLGRKIGFSLRDVKQMMDLYDPSGTNARQLRVTLEKSEKQLARLNKQRALLDEAIGDLQQLLLTVREKLAA